MLLQQLCNCISSQFGGSGQTLPDKGEEVGAYDGVGRGFAAPGGHCAAVRSPAVPQRRIPEAVLLIRNIGRPHCCGGEERGGAERGEAASPGEGRSGRCWAGHARLAGRDGERQRRQGRVVQVGGRGSQTWAWAWRVAGWGVPGLHKASRRSSTGGTPLSPQQQPSSEHWQPPGGAG